MSQRSEHITGQHCTHGTVIISSVLSAQERQSSFSPFVILECVNTPLAFSVIPLLLILRWILGHPMTMNVALRRGTEWNDSILATRWKAI